MKQHIIIYSFIFLFISCKDDKQIVPDELRNVVWLQIRENNNKYYKYCKNHTNQDSIYFKGDKMYFNIIEPIHQTVDSIKSKANEYIIKFKDYDFEFANNITKETVGYKYTFKWLDRAKKIAVWKLIDLEGNEDHDYAFYTIDRSNYNKLPPLLVRNVIAKKSVKKKKQKSATTNYETPYKS